MNGGGLCGGVAGGGRGRELGGTYNNVTRGLWGQGGRNERKSGVCKLLSKLGLCARAWAPCAGCPQYLGTAHLEERGRGAGAGRLPREQGPHHETRVDADLVARRALGQQCAVGCWLPQHVP